MSAEDVVIGILALVVGGLFCFRGAIAMRFVIALWGAFTGFVLGAGIVAGVDDAGFLRGLAAWIAACIGALVLGALAYAFYEVAVTLAMAAIGFALGSTAMVAFGVSWSWGVVVVGAMVGLALAVITLAADLPTVLLLVLSAFGGASAMVTGVMLLVDRVDTDGFTRADTTELLRSSWWWYALYLGLAVVGMIVQFRYLDSLRGSMHDQWRGARDA